MINKLKNGSGTFVSDTLAEIKKNDVISMRVIYDQIIRAQNQSLKEAFISDFRVSQR